MYSPRSLLHIASVIWIALLVGWSPAVRCHQLPQLLDDISFSDAPVSSPEDFEQLLLRVVSDSLSVTEMESGDIRILSSLLFPTTEAEGPLCREHTQILLSSLKRGQLWAIEMLDSCGKLPDGILRGNTHALGQWEECLAVEVKLNASDYPHLSNDQLAFRGRYAMTSVKPVGSHYGVGAAILPKEIGMQIRSGLCVPSSCSSDDIGSTLEKLLGDNFTVDVISTHTAEDKTQFSTGDCVMITICALVLALMVAGTITDLFLRYKQQKRVEGHSQTATAEPAEPLLHWSVRVLLAFSVYTNGLRILDTRHPKGSLPCLNGLRFFSMMWVLTGHAFLVILGYARNGADFFQWAKNFNFSIVLNAYPAVDTFFLLSGLLLGFVFLKHWERHHRFNLALFYIHRYLRLTPPYAAVLAITCTWYVHLMEGPVWRAGVMPQINTCKQVWWQNMLYIQNYFSVSDPSAECMPQTWYLSNDMQLFVLSPLVLLPLVWKPVLGAVWLVLVITGLMVTRIVIWWLWELPPDRMMLRPEHAQQLTDIYSSIWARAPVWLIGIGLGCLLHRLKNRKVQLKSWQWVLGWLVAVGVGLSVEYGLTNYQIPGVHYTRAVAMSYGVTHRVAWALAVSWVIFACVTGYGGFINTFLSYPGFLPLSRLTYCCYLLQFSVLEAGSDSTKGTVYFDTVRICYLVISNIVVTFFCAFVLSLSFELPFINMERILLPEGR